MELNNIQAKIETKQEFVDFLKSLLNDYQQNRDNWENVSLENFLEAMHGYAQDLEGFYLNNNLPFDEKNPSWKNFSQILLGARIYE